MTLMVEIDGGAYVSHDDHQRAVAEAVANERARIVAWLRGHIGHWKEAYRQSSPRETIGAVEAMVQTIEAIEAGEHLGVKS